VTSLARCEVTRLPRERGLRNRRAVKPSARMKRRSRDRLVTFKRRDGGGACVRGRVSLSGGSQLHSSLAAPVLTALLTCFLVLRYLLRA
jgi:hypothetical protein